MNDAAEARRITAQLAQADYIKQLVDKAPPLTVAQRMSLTALLNPTVIEDFEVMRLREQHGMTEREARANIAAMEEAKRLNLGDIGGLADDETDVELDTEPRDRGEAANRPCALYRHFDNEGTLLYVGISVDPDSRRTQHRYQSGWFRFAERMAVEWFDSTAIATRAERNAIRDETPIFNKAHAGDGRATRAVAYLVEHDASDLLRPAI